MEINVGHSYTGTIVHSNGTAPFTIQSTGLGSLSATVNGTIVTISGTAPNTPQTVNFSITVQDYADLTDTQSYSLIVDPYIVTNTSNDSSVIGSLPYEAAQANSDTSGTAIVINFAARAGQTFGTPQLIVLAGTLNLDNTTAGESISIDGPAAALNIQGGTSDFSVVTVAAGTTANLQNLTISNGFTSDGGGGINNSGMLTVTNSTISDNSAAAFLRRPPFLTGSVGDGGGIYNTGTLIVSNSTLADNSATSDGGGIFNSGTLLVGNCTLASNSASNGRDIANESGGSTTLNNTIVANSPSGGDLYLDSGNASTFSGGYDLIGDGSNLSSFTNSREGDRASRRWAISEVRPRPCPSCPTVQRTSWAASL